MRRARPLAAIALALLVGLATLASVLVGRAADDEKGILADLISRALSTPATRVSIGAIEGALSSDATIRDIRIEDRDGVWLRLDRARIVWRRLALLARRLEIDTLEIGTLDVARRPIPAETAVAGEAAPLLPELPVRVEIKAFRLGELRVGEPLLGTAARVGATGAVRLGNPAEGLDLTLDARRLDAAGQLTARLGLVPQGGRLTLSLGLDEPAGGILARAASIPGLPPVKLDLKGDGTLDAFRANLTFDAGTDIAASGTATLDRDGAARRLALSLDGQVGGLLPDVAAPVFAGTTQIRGGARFGDAGDIAIQDLSLVAAAARLDIAGAIGADRTADLRVTARNVENAAGRTSVGGAEIRRLAFDGRVTGPLVEPRIEATLNAEDARLPAGRVAQLEASVAATPSATPGPTALRATVRATGLAPTDPAVARALGAEASLDLSGALDGSGPARIDRLELRTPSLNARFAGRAGSSELQGRAELGLADLSRFSGLAGLALAGTATLTADLEGTPRARRFNARIDGKAERFATGIAPVDGLVGGTTSIAGGARLSATGAIGFDDLRLTGPGGTLRLDGEAAPDRADLGVTAAIADLRRVDTRLTGRADLAGRLTGSLERPDANARVTVVDATALGRPVSGLTLDIVGRDLRAAPDLRLTLDGEIDRKPARGRLHLVRAAGGATTIDDVDLTVGSASVKGGVALDAGGFASGRITLAAPNLDDLSPLVLTRLRGQLSADVTLSAANGGQDASVKAGAERLAAYGVTVDRFNADLRATDLYRRPVVAGTAAIEEAAFGGERVSRIRLTATPVGGPVGAAAPAGSQASDIVLTAAARGFDLDARARIVPGERTRIEVSQFGASRGSQRIALAGPATLTLADGGVDLAGVAIGLGAGRLTLAGRAGSQLDLRVEARAVPLSTADIFAPGLGLAGTLDGTATIEGPASAPTGEYRARIVGLAAQQTRGLGLPPIEATAAGRLAGGRATIDANLAAGQAGSIRIGGSVPVGAGTLDVTVRGAIDAAAATRGLLASGGRRLTGRFDVDARVGGTLGRPEAGGSATLSGGSFTDAAQGVRLDNIRARLVARGEEVSLESASATTRNDGTLSASGRIRLDPAAGFPGQIRITGRRAELVRSSLATAVADLDLDISGPLARLPRVGGRVAIASLDVTVPERLSATLRPLPGTRHVRPTPQARARLALDARRKGGRAEPPFDAALDLTVSAPSGVVVHGRGLNAELGGNLRLTGTLAAPRPVGAFELRSGRLQILSSRLDFRRGRLAFAGDLSPELDFLAETSAGGASIGIAISGPASEPQFAFTSSPDLPQDEILSRLLFNSPSGQLTTGQALALAQAAAQFSGGEGSDVFEGLRRSLGLGGLDINLGAGGGPGVGLSKALNDRVSVGVRAGPSAAQTGIGVDVRITDEIKLKGEVGSNGATSVGIGAEKEW